MRHKTRTALLLAAVMMVPGLGADADPVQRIRAERAAAQGIPEADLPPVPRTITDPPPLPPPELHRRDARGGRTAKVARSSRRAGKSTRAGARTAKAKGTVKRAAKSAPRKRRR